MATHTGAVVVLAVLGLSAAAIYAVAPASPDFGRLAQGDRVVLISDDDSVVLTDVPRECFPPDALVPFLVKGVPAGTHAFVVLDGDPLLNGDRKVKVNVTDPPNVGLLGSVSRSRLKRDAARP